MALRRGVVRTDGNDKGRQVLLDNCLLYTSEDPEKEITLASYEYDSDGNMTLQRNAAGDVMTYEYAGRLIVKETWRNGLASVSYTHLDVYKRQNLCMTIPI